eukprot:m.9333 g.9333  ORF g.9333 m.9333 type:complete len:1041 (-) comp4048_c0_seq2:54-3176(-)
MGEDNVKVAVRVRPFNAREKSRNAKLIIDMNNNTTLISDPDAPEKEPRKFTFDHSYWSHDGATETDDGMFVAESSESRYADQQKVFNDLGVGMLENAWKGYNCSLFAYGQTGSGKSYSVMGYGANKGIVPLLCDQLFNGIEEKGIDCQVSLSMLEIYNECVHDLLSKKAREKGGMKIRNHPKKGFYVDGLTVTPVQNFAAIENRIDEGTKNRTVAATQMNATSSRAHTIVTVHFSQKADNAQGQSMTKTASINLVDLAGSERADSTGATGDRLKEGSAINKSLSSLGNVIAALADLSDPKKKKVVVPFRNSVLTMLLKNALSGNSKTIMCAALSPADINYEETLSTLRFADRAKQIKTKAVVNESPTDKLIRELREENARLQAMLGGGAVPAPSTGTVSADPAEVKRLEEAHRKAQEEMERQLKQNQEEMEMMQQSWEERLKAAEKRKAEEDRMQSLAREEKDKIPHLWNMNEDVLLEGVVCHFVPENSTKTVGNKKANPAPDIVFAGLGIQESHAIIENKEGIITITRADPEAKLIFNGDPINDDDPHELHHHCRILFGNNHLYCFEHPTERDDGMSSGVKWVRPKFADAQAEIADHAGYSAGSSSDSALQEELVSIMPHVNEANAISLELNKKCFFEIILVAPAEYGGNALPEINVKAHDLARQINWLWSRETFLNRKYIMQEMYQSFSDQEDWDRPQAEDPFWEPVQHQLLGSAFLYLGGLGYMIDIDEHVAITDSQGTEQGHVHASIKFADATGVQLTEDDLDDLFVDEPKENIGKRMDLLLGIISVKGLRKEDANEVYCSFRFMDQEMKHTQQISGKVNPVFNYEEHIPIEKVTQDHVDYFDSQAVKISVYKKPTPADTSKTENMSTAELFEMHRGKRPSTGTVRRRASMARWENDDGDDSIGLAKTEEQKEAEITDLHAELHQSIMNATTEHRRAHRLREKLKRVEEAMKTARANGETSVPLTTLDKALHPSHARRFRGIVKVVIMTNRMKKLKEAMQGSNGESELAQESDSKVKRKSEKVKGQTEFSKLCVIQ